MMIAEPTRTMDEPFAVETVQEEGQIRVSVRGELDITTADRFDDAIDRAACHRCELVIDLREATFMGARALGAIASASQRLSAHATVSVKTGGPLQRRLLASTGVDALVVVDPPTPDGDAEGLAAASSSPGRGSI